MSNSGVYTCNSCVLKFDASEEQRAHMKSDWHRYNLKRRVAQLPPIPFETFDSKVSAAAANSNEVAGKEKPVTKKELKRRERQALLEKKTKLLEIARANMLENMQKSQDGEVLGMSKLSLQEKEETKEKKEVKEDEEPEELTEEEMAERLMEQKLRNKVDIPLEQCLFCEHNKNFVDFEENLEHMFRTHGFYIPEQKFLVNKSGLVKYMSEKIGLGNVCIVCNFQGRTLTAVRQHMLAKRHCKIPYEIEDERLEISEFYDFTSSYASYSNNTAAGNEEDWEDVGSDEAGSDDDEPPQEYLYNDGTELHLPTGIKVGHRSLQRYYKQDLKPEVILTEGQGTLVAAETRSFLPIFDKLGVQTQQRVWQTERFDKKRLDKRSAKFVNNQPYYRDQLLQ
ncbi:pre-60S factor rei1 [Saccharomyces pastorianus]|uniref:Pre-60S factor rei1 n=1 Tax=Saccharomyces pastorianus TaxID=27292 RepID=A0A6C1E666_SACPS|nr:REI1-like protein [Saccharomyces eubayanus]KOH00578.1 REI1-like protein [Saccharomyces eubayanus]QID84431.1 pre-60S factor rei1 [Saccharomyces pastorianus]